ncbi:hypothetical protein GCM10022408_34480 [Hymenobacter fastidiosus]|uniref:Uncharacterized protein n=1 Tax=Hymenobacter fastidiosus TaxID=486264 RepID=A0ABP7SXU3_9BACT
MFNDSGATTKKSWHHLPTQTTPSLALSTLSPPPVPTPPETEKPPLLPSWRAWYALVLGVLAAELVFFTLLTRYFA